MVGGVWENDSLVVFSMGILWFDVVIHFCLRIFLIKNKYPANLRNAFTIIIWPIITRMSYFKLPLLIVGYIWILVMELIIFTVYSCKLFQIDIHYLTRRIGAISDNI